MPWPPQQQKCWWPRCSSTASYQREEQDSDLSMVSFFRLPRRSSSNTNSESNKKWSIYIRANRGIYGLSQAGLLANKLLEKRLNKHGYHQSNWNFGCVSNTFTMVVDDFGVKYVGEEHVNHLKATLEEHYKLT